MTNTSGLVVFLLCWLSAIICAGIAIERAKAHARRLRVGERAIAQLEEADKIAEKKAEIKAAMADKEAEREAILMSLENPQLGNIDDKPEAPGDDVTDTYRSM